MKWILLIPILFSSFALAAERSTWKSMLVNSVSLDVSDSRTKVYLQDRDSLATKNKPAGSQGGGLSQFINSVSFSKIPEVATQEGSFRLSGVSIFTFAFNNLTFNSPAVYLEQTDFQIFRTSAGYGPELTYTQFGGVFYINVSAGAAYSWVSWSSPLSGGSMAKSNLNVAGTFGFYRRFLKDWAVKAFFKDIYEDTGVWKEALSSSQGFAVPVTRVNNMVAGISFCWLFR